MKTCPRCQLQHEKDGTYCSRKCANSQKVIAGETKSCLCSICRKEIRIGKRGNPATAMCDSCYRGSCEICGQAKCPRPDICCRRKVIKGPSLVRLGFDKSKLGSLEALEEYERCLNLLQEDYASGLSTADLCERYSFPDGSSFRFLIRSLGLNLRSLSQAVSLAIQQGKFSPGTGGYNQLQCGWHTTWNNKKAFLRSSYELEYAKHLDEKQIDYDVEALRILYWDSQLLCQRVAIPDFYLPATNTIIEIKADGSPWYDPQNMEDKKKAYLAHGYNFELKLW